MPIHEFECNACGYRFERLQKLSDADPTECPQCGKSPVRRRVSAPAFRLAGSGWYETDFKKEGEVKHNLASKDEPPNKAATNKADVNKTDTAKAETASSGKADSAAKDSKPPATVKPSASDSTSST